jgi:hypothetical protein
LSTKAAAGRRIAAALTTDTIRASLAWEHDDRQFCVLLQHSSGVGLRCKVGVTEAGEADLSSMYHPPGMDGWPCRVGSDDRRRELAREALEDAAIECCPDGV